MLKIGFISHDYKEQLDTKEVNDIMKQIGEPSVITEIPTFSDEHAYAIHNADANLLNILSKEELENVWNAVMPFRWGDYDEYSSEIKKYFSKDIMIIPAEEFKKLI